MFYVAALLKHNRWHEVPTETRDDFEFDTQAVVLYFEKRLNRLEESRSHHKAQAVWDQKYIDYMRQQLQRIQAAVSANTVPVFDWDKIQVEPQWYADHIIQDLIRNGYGLCLCPQCDEVYKVSDLEVQEETGGENGGEFVQCPQGHETGIYFSVRMGVIGEQYPPSHIRIYKIGKGGNKPSVFECPFIY